MRILYLHGFASSPQSRKARYFSDKLAALGITLQVPDLAEGDFERLTLSSQLKFIEEQTGGFPVTLIGSSLGGYLAALFAAANQQQVQRLLLLAPAFGLWELWQSALGAERLAAWRAHGFQEFFHYGLGRKAHLHFGFLEDAKKFEPFPVVPQPVLIFHSERDESVPVERSVEFVRRNPRAKLVRFHESNHELGDVLDSIWDQSWEFLVGGPEET